MVDKRKARKHYAKQARRAKQYKSKQRSKAVNAARKRAGNKGCVLILFLPLLLTLIIGLAYAKSWS